jgi:hypothetical protein
MDSKLSAKDNLKDEYFLNSAPRQLCAKHHASISTRFAGGEINY